VKWRLYSLLHHEILTSLEHSFLDLLLFTHLLFPQNLRMQQPLAHLYFFTVLEHLQAKNYQLSGLVRIANAIMQECASSASREVEKMILWVELQGVVQVILQKLAMYPDQSVLQEVHQMKDDIHK